MEHIISPEEMVILEDIASRATANAADALGRFSGSKLVVDKVTLEAVPMEAIPLLAPPEEIVVAIRLAHQQDAEGFLLAVIKEDDALSLIRALVGSNPDRLADLDEMELSALSETGNILTASFLATLETQCGMVVLPSPPSIAIDFAGAALTDALLPVAAQTGAVYVAQSEIVPVQDDISAMTTVQLFFSPSLPSWIRIFQAAKATGLSTSR